MYKLIILEDTNASWTENIKQYGRLQFCMLEVSMHLSHDQKYTIVFEHYLLVLKRPSNKIIDTTAGF